MMYDKRATTVEIVCGSVDAVLDIREDRTCHYHIKVSSVRLCKCADFAPNAAQYKRISFYPVAYPTSGDGNSAEDRSSYQVALE